MSAPRDRNPRNDGHYNPPAVRRQLHLPQRLLLPSYTSFAEFDDCAFNSATTPPASLSLSSAFRGGGDLSNSTNLDRFLKCTVPIVPGMHFSKTSMRGWGTEEGDFQPYFVLGDLWESFSEWSAYGVGVPVLLNENDHVVQYYVPYLSGIQLYIDPSMPNPRTRTLSEKSSESISDYETDMGLNCSFRGVQNQQDLVEGIRGLSISNKTLSSSSSDNDGFVRPLGVLAFEYFEQELPCSRQPLATKMSLLASDLPELNTYRSCDLSPASWACVAWYPIFRIPIGETLESLDSCFLTFHSLSTPSRGAQNQWQCPFGSQPRVVSRGFDTDLKLSLPTFGLSSYKFKAAFWENTGADGYPKTDALLQAADHWLQLLNVRLPDYIFFESRNSQSR